MSFLFTTTTLPEPTEEKIKSLMAIVMQNGLMIQQLQLMVALQQKEIEEEEQREESRQRKEKETEEEKKKQKGLRGEEIRTMKTWSEEESQRYVKRFRGYKGNTRYRKCGWFGYMAHYYRRMEIEAERKLRGGLCENRWKPLKCRMMACDEERMAVRSIKREAQQLVRYWECGEEGHCLWTCPKKVACPEQGKAQQRKLVCRECKKENHVTRNCDGYWRWREQELRRKVKELKEKAIKEERVVRHTM